MKLKKCYVYAFGNLRDYTVEFDDKLNTIKQDNGWGKSTLATFIKCIFYGFKGDKKHSVSDNERLKYMPWNSTEKFGGYVEFEWGNKLFKIERFFGSKIADDTVKLYDVETGKSYPNTDDLGRRIFEIDEDGFLSTTYFSQKDFEIKSNTSLTAKFNQVFEVQDTVKYDNAIKKLEEQSKLYKMRGDKGKIADAKRALFNLDEKISSVALCQKTAKNLAENNDLLDKELAKTKRDINDLTKQLDLSAKARIISMNKQRLSDLRLEAKRLDEQKQKIDFILNGNDLTKEQINHCQSCVNKLQEVNASEEILRSDIASYSNEIKTKAPTKNNNKTPMIICLAISIIFVLFGAISFAFLPIFIGIVGLCLGVIFAVLTLVFAKKSGKKVQVDDAVIRLKEQKVTRLNELLEVKSKLDGEIRAFFIKYNLQFTDFNDAFNKLYVLLAERDNIKVQSSKINGELQVLLQDQSLNLDVEKVEDMQVLNQRLSESNDRYERLSRERARNLAEQTRQQEIADSLPDLQSERVAILEKIDQYTEEYDTIIKTLDYLRQADENLKIRYKKPLENSLNKYLGYILEGQKSAQIDIDLHVTIDENGKAMSTDYYSKGYQNLFEICKRFALTDVFFTKEKPFIILDDPFYNLDDKKLQASIDLIKKLSNDYQIIYFVCHESRRA